MGRERKEDSYHSSSFRTMAQSRKRAYNGDSASAKKSRSTKSSRSRKVAYAKKHRYDLQTPKTFGEVKSVDQTLTNRVFNTTGTVAHINIIPQGVADDERDGKSAKVTSIQLKGYAVTDTLTVGAVCRYMIIYDHKPSGVLPAVTDILTSASVSAFPRWDQKHRFLVLRDTTFTLAGSYTAPGTGDIVNPIASVVDYIKLPSDLTSQWTSSDTLGTIATATEGAIYLLTVGSPVAGDTDAQMSCQVRTSFLDC